MNSKQNSRSSHVDMLPLFNARHAIWTGLDGETFMHLFDDDVVDHFRDETVSRENKQIQMYNPKTMKTRTFTLRSVVKTLSNITVYRFSTGELHGIDSVNLSVYETGC